ncbi:hypothetical protein GCM10020331_008540 [Ectobacillus funiculus]
MEYIEVTQGEVEEIFFHKRLSGEQLSSEELVAYRSFLLKELGKKCMPKKTMGHAASYGSNPK